MEADSWSKREIYIFRFLRFHLSTPAEREALDPWRFALGLSTVVTSTALILALTLLFLLDVFGLIPSPKTAFVVCATLTGMLTFSISFMVSYSLAKQVKSLSISHELFERLSQTDGLTGLHNRVGLQAGSVELGHNYCIAFLDIDRFKSINDTYGHAAGDAVISGVARLIVDAFPASALVCRLGGEEFVVAVSDVPLAVFATYCQDCREAVAESTFAADSVSISITVSIGIAVSQADQPFEHIMHRADVALYKAKASGRNIVIVDDGKDIDRLTV